MNSDSNDIRKKIMYGSLAVLLALAYLLTMTSCSSSTATDSMNYKSESGGFQYFADGAAPEEMVYAEMESPSMSMSAASDSMYSAKSAQTKNSAAETKQNDLSARKLIKTANLSVETKDFDTFIAVLEGNIAEMGGYLSSSSVNGSSYSSDRVRYAHLTVRIPADAFDAFVSGVGDYGNVTYRSESVDDVTMSYVDTESRIKAYETEYATLLDILEKAESLNDVLVIQNRITEVTYQLESYRSQLRKYDDLISYCTVYIDVNEVVELTEIKEPPATVGQRMIRGLKDTCEDIADDAERFAVWFVSSLPLLVIYAVCITAAVLILRKIAPAIRRKLPAKHRSANADSDNTDNT